MSRKRKGQLESIYREADRNEKKGLRKKWFVNEFNGCAPWDDYAGKEKDRKPEIKIIFDALNQYHELLCLDRETIIALILELERVNFDLDKLQFEYGQKFLLPAILTIHENEQQLDL